MKARACFVVTFHDDGTAEFFPFGDPVELADRLFHLVRFFRTHPDAVNCAAGLHDPSDHPAGTCR